jgi:hypothetical protein
MLSITATRAEIEETWLGLWEREIARFDWLVSIKQSKIMHNLAVVTASESIRRQRRISSQEGQQLGSPAAHSRSTATYKHTRAEIEETWLGLWEREIARFDWLVSIKQSKFLCSAIGVCMILLCLMETSQSNLAISLSHNPNQVSSISAPQLLTFLGRDASLSPD